MEEIIKEIEARGYIVRATENMYRGELDKTCPIVYNIYNPDWSTVYGASGIGPDDLAKWSNDRNLPVIGKPAKKEQPKTAHTVADAKKEQDWDDLYNEGGEGYNPYRA